MNPSTFQERGSRGYLLSIVCVAVLGGLLFGYDTAVISGAEKGLQAFFLGADDFYYSDAWHGFTCASALIGCIIGSCVSGVMASGWGRKKTLFFAGCMFFISALGSMEPEFLLFNRGEASFSLMLMFNFYRIVGGIGVGLASAVCPMYIGEMSPSNIRGMLVSWNQFAIIFGQLLVYFINFLILGSNVNPVLDLVNGTYQIMNPEASAWTVATGWRYMFGSEAVPAGLFALLICLVPESPRYLVMTGKEDNAMRILAKINGRAQATAIIQDIRNTIVERTERLFSYGFICIFVGIMLSVFQQAVGINAVLYYAPRIFHDMGMENPMVQTVIMGVVNITFTLVAIFTVEKWGRKPLLITGSIGMGIGAICVALTFGNEAYSTLTMLSIMLYSASFMMSWGPICWVLIAEIFPNTIRGKAVAVAVAFQWIFNWIVSSSFVPMFNMHLTPGDDFGHWFTYGLYGIVCIIAAVFVWRMVPETKGMKLEDMSRMWREKMK